MLPFLFFLFLKKNNRAGGGVLQDKQLKHRARTAVRASTVLLQNKPLKYRARIFEAHLWWAVQMLKGSEN